MRALLIILTLITLIGCEEDNENMNGFNLENQILLNLKNSDGLNLLDTSTENSYNNESMKLFYLVNDEPIEVTIENGFNMGSLELTSDKLLKIFTNPSSSNIVEETSEYDIVENVAFLELSETDTDTIKTHSLSKNLSHSTANGNCCYFLVSKVWYNDELVWESETGGIIEITKE
jgi:hypothetical protein